MIIEEAALSDEWLQIEVSDLFPAAWAGRGRSTALTRLSTRRRSRRYVASLLVAALLALGLAPGEHASRHAAPVMPSASAHSAARPLPPDWRAIEQHLRSRAPQASSVSAQDACPTFPGHPRCVP
jgi:hypothetical protein